MIEWLESIDRLIVLSINGWWSPWADEFFWLVSAKAVWIPFYLFIFWQVAKTYGWKTMWLFLPIAIVSVGFADFTSAQIIKESVARYRPSHHALLTDELRFYQIDADNVYKGGQYGFVSSHAANFATICCWIVLLFRRRKNWMVYLALAVFALVGYSRIYLGVHYLSDVLGGLILGSAIAILFHRFVFQKVLHKLGLA